MPSPGPVTTGGSPLREPEESWIAACGDPRPGNGLGESGDRAGRPIRLGQRPHPVPLDPVSWTTVQRVRGPP
jgi:hypothetical protein